MLKFQWKGISVALEKLVLLKLSHNSGKLHLLVFISDPQNSLVWKTGILEDILLPGCTVFSKFSFSINHNPAILEDLLCLSFCCVAPLRRMWQNIVWRRQVTSPTAIIPPEAKIIPATTKSTWNSGGWINGCRKSAPGDTQGLPESETEELSIATPPFGPGERNTTGIPLTAAKNKVGRAVRYLCIWSHVSCTC